MIKSKASSSIELGSKSMKKAGGCFMGCCGNTCSGKVKQSKCWREMNVDFCEDHGLVVAQVFALNAQIDTLGTIMPLKLIYLYALDMLKLAALVWYAFSFIN